MNRFSLFKTGLPIANEIIEINRMSQIERKYKRNKKDLYDYLGTHLISIIRTFIVLGVLYLIVDNRLVHDFYSFLYITLIFGFVSTLSYKMGRKGLSFFLLKSLNIIKNMFRHVFSKTIETKNYLKSDLSSIQKKDRNSIWKLIYIILAIIITFTFFVWGFLITFGSLILILLGILYFNNENTALIVGYFLYLFLDLQFNVSVQAKYVIIALAMYFVIDSYVRLFLMKFSQTDIIDYDKDIYVHQELVSYNSNLDIYKINEERNIFHLYDKTADHVKVIRCESKYDKRKKELEDLFGIISKKANG